MEKKKNNTLIDKCPVCNGELSEKTVEKLLRGGNNIASVKVKAMVCMSCGERYYSLESVKQFEEIRKKLKTSKTTGLKRIGASYALVNT